MRHAGKGIAVRIEDGGAGQIVTDDVDVAVAVTGEVARRRDSSDEFVIAAGDGESMDAAVAWSATQTRRRGSTTIPVGVQVFTKPWGDSIRHGGGAPADCGLHGISGEIGKEVAADRKRRC